MPITDINRTDNQDNSVSAIGENESVNTARVGLRESGLYGLHTLAEVTAPTTGKFWVLPVSPMPTFGANMLNGASAAMNVNGSAVNVNFSFAPANGEIRYVDSLSISLVDAGTMSLTNFASLAALTNGFDLIYRYSGVNYTLVNIKNNAQLASYFSSMQNIATQAAGYSDVSDAIWGTINFRNPLILNGTNGDYLRIVIKDNLTGIDIFQSYLTYLRQL